MGEEEGGRGWDWLKPKYVIWPIVAVIIIIVLVVAALQIPWVAVILTQFAGGAFGVFLGYLLGVWTDRRKKVATDRETAREALTVLGNDLKSTLQTLEEIYEKFREEPKTASLWTVTASTWDALAPRISGVVHPTLTHSISEVYSGYRILGRRLDNSLRFYTGIVLRSENDPDLRENLLERYATHSEQIVRQLRREEDAETVGLIHETEKLMGELERYIQRLVKRTPEGASTSRRTSGS